MQKTRMLFALFIALPILSLSLKPGKAEKNDFLGFRGQIYEKVKAFKSKTGKEKDKILKDLDSSISDLNEKIKGYSEKKEKPKDDIINLMKKILEINEYMKYRICGQEDAKCRNRKKRYMHNLLAALKDNFEKCETTIEHVTKLTDNAHSNLVALTLILQSIVDNKDLIEKSKIDMIANIVDCLKKNIDDYMGKIETLYKDNLHIVPYLKESQLQTLSSLANALSELKGLDDVTESEYAETNDFLGFRGQLYEKLKAFKSKTEKEKDEILKELDSSLSDLNEEIQKYIKEKNQKPKDDIVDLMKKILEISHYMRYRVCDQEDENCRNEQKMLMNNLLAVLQDNFGKCEETIELVTKLTSNTHSNLVVLTLIIQSIVDNKDFIVGKKANIIINIINCLTEKIDDYMNQIEKDYKGNPHIVPYLKDSQLKTLANALLELNGLDDVDGLLLEPAYAKTNNDFLGFRGQLHEKVKAFKSKTGKEKDKILRELDSSITDLNERIQNKEKKPYNDIVDLMKKILEISNYMQYRVCGKDDINCKNRKRRYMHNLLAALKDNFEKCDNTYKYVTKLTDNTHSNLVALTLILQSIVDNKDLIEKSKIDMIANIVDCLKKNIDDYMGKIETLYKDNLHIVPYLKESQLQTLSSLANALSELKGLDDVTESEYAETNDFLGFRGQLYEKLKAFKSKTEKEKDEILKELDSSLSDLNEEIQKYIKEKNQKPKDDIVDLMKKILEISHYMKYRVCNQGDENCRNEKKRLMNNILSALHDNFKNESVTYQRVTKLTRNAHSNLAVLTSIIQAIVDNKDYIEKSKRKIITDIIDWIKNNFNKIMKEIKDLYVNNTFIEEYINGNQLVTLQNALSELGGKTEKDSESKKFSFATRVDVYGEIIDVLKEIKATNKTLIIIVSCLATITILIGGFLLYRTIRRKNSNIIENNQVLETSENKVNK